MRQSLSVNDPAVATKIRERFQPPLGQSPNHFVHLVLQRPGTMNGLDRVWVSAFDQRQNVVADPVAGVDGALVAGVFPPRLTNFAKAGSQGVAANLQERPAKNDVGIQFGNLRVRSSLGGPVVADSLG